MAGLAGSKKLAGGAPVYPDSARKRVVPRGYTLGHEILTEWGFVRFDSLYTEEYLGEAIKFVPTVDYGGSEAKEIVYGHWRTNENFPAVATVNMVTGRVEYVRPSVFMFYEYRDKVVRLKGKGIHLECARWTDVMVKPRYGRGWRFQLADDITRNTQPTFYYGIVDKFSESLYGEYDPQPGLVADLGKPFHVTPKHAERRLVPTAFQWADGTPRVEVPVFNVDTGEGSNHTVVVRLGRANDLPRTPWVGNPVVVGDGSDKSLMRIDSVKKGSHAGGSYSKVHPGFREFQSYRGKDDLGKDLS